MADREAGHPGDGAAEQSWTPQAARPGRAPGSRCHLRGLRLRTAAPLQPLGDSAREDGQGTLSSPGFSQDSFVTQPGVHTCASSSGEDAWKVGSASPRREPGSPRAGREADLPLQRPGMSGASFSRCAPLARPFPVRASRAQLWRREGPTQVSRVPPARAPSVHTSEPENLWPRQHLPPCRSPKRPRWRPSLPCPCPAPAAPSDPSASLSFTPGSLAHL